MVLGEPLGQEEVKGGDGDGDGDGGIDDVEGDGEDQDDTSSRGALHLHVRLACGPSTSGSLRQSLHSVVESLLTQTLAHVFIRSRPSPHRNVLPPTNSRRVITSLYEPATSHLTASPPWLASLDTDFNLTYMPGRGDIASEGVWYVRSGCIVRVRMQGADVGAGEGGCEVAGPAISTTGTTNATSATSAISATSATSATSAIITISTTVTIAPRSGLWSSLAIAVVDVDNVATRVGRLDGSLAPLPVPNSGTQGPLVAQFPFSSR